MAFVAPSMWNLPQPGTDPASLHWQADSHPLYHQGRPAHFFFLRKWIYEGQKKNIHGRLHHKLRRTTTSREKRTGERRSFHIFVPFEF